MLLMIAQVGGATCLDPPCGSQPWTGLGIVPRGLGAVLASRWRWSGALAADRVLHTQVSSYLTNNEEETMTMFTAKNTCWQGETLLSSKSAASVTSLPCEWSRHHHGAFDMVQLLSDMQVYISCSTRELLGCDLPLCFSRLPSQVPSGQVGPPSAPNTFKLCYLQK
jgi:hypothetical protein